MGFDTFKHRRLEVRTHMHLSAELESEAVGPCELAGKRSQDRQFQGLVKGRGVGGAVSKIKGLTWEKPS